MTESSGLLFDHNVLGAFFFFFFLHTTSEHQHSDMISILALQPTPTHCFSPTAISSSCKVLWKSSHLPFTKLSQNRALLTCVRKLLFFWGGGLYTFVPIIHIVAHNNNALNKYCHTWSLNSSSYNFPLSLHLFLNPWQKALDFHENMGILGISAVLFVGETC